MAKTPKGYVGGLILTLRELEATGDALTAQKWMRRGIYQVAMYIHQDTGQTLWRTYHTTGAESWEQKATLALD